MKSFILTFFALFCVFNFVAKGQPSKPNPLGSAAANPQAQNPPSPISTASPQSDEATKPPIEAVL